MKWKPKSVWQSYAADFRLIDRAAQLSEQHVIAQKKQIAFL